jgi:pimeloyl-ACP methyl ester carboxylesterase
MRQKFHDSYKDRIHCLVRLTEAQNPFFEELDQNLDGYRACKVPTLIISGEDDRAIPIWMQRKLCEIYPNYKFIAIPACGHMTYLEYPDIFWGSLKRTMQEKSVDWDG